MRKFILLLVIIVSFAGFNSLTAQAPPPPPEQHGLGGNQPNGGGAPLDEGLGMLLLFAAVYGAQKLRNKSKETITEN